MKNLRRFRFVSSALPSVAASAAVLQLPAQARAMQGMTMPMSGQTQEDGRGPTGIWVFLRLRPTPMAH